MGEALTLKRHLKKPLAPLLEFVKGLKGSVRSFSQFGEDVVLEALLKRLLAEAEFSCDRKIYVDIGANSAIRHSNSYFLYRAGWRGILVEPTPLSRVSYKVLRPRDKYFGNIVSDGAGVVEFYSFGPQSVFNTMDRAQAEAVRARFGVAPETVFIEAISLEQMLGRANLTLRDVGILFVDVEGAEMKVLGSVGLGESGPYIVVVEVLGNRIEDVLQSTVVAHLRGRGYELYAWPNPSLIFLRRDLHYKLQHS